MTTLPGAIPSFFGRRVDDAAIGLVRHKPIQIAGARSGRLEGLRNDVCHHANRMPENLSPAIRKCPVVRVVDGPPST